MFLFYNIHHLFLIRTIDIDVKVLNYLTSFLNKEFFLNTCVYNTCPFSVWHNVVLVFCVWNRSGKGQKCSYAVDYTARV